MLTHSQIRSMLPHRYPMLLVDTVELCTPGVSLVAKKNVTCNEPCFADFLNDADPYSLIYPHSLILESFLQAAGILFLKSWDLSGDPSHSVMLFGGISGCSFYSEVVPGESLEHRAKLDRTVSETGFVSGEVWVGARQVAKIQQVLIAVRPIKAFALEQDRTDG